MLCLLPFAPQWGIAHAEMKVPPAEYLYLLKAFLLKSAIGQNMTSYASPAARKSTFSGHSTSFFPNPLPNFYPQWGTADAEIKVLSVENPELKGPPFKAWSRPF